MKNNVDKCNLLNSKNDRVSINLDGCKIDESGTATMFIIF